MSRWDQIITHLQASGIAFEPIGVDAISLRFDFDDGRSEKVIAKRLTLRNFHRCELTALLGTTSSAVSPAKLLELNAELPCGSVCTIANRYLLRHVLHLDHTDGPAFEFCVREFAGRADAIERDVFMA